ncbi:MAG: segregation/condensation protein A [Candidatus Aenigmarchaeota archaeon]|nr:segregation/condensation protein A [Candidatus Aenigmarchaeota archaeon]
MIDEKQLLQTIVKGSDWTEVLTNIIAEEGLDPWSINIVELTDLFVEYLQRLKTFDFRIPARFILIAAMLLRMKCELLFQEEKEQVQKEAEMPNIDIGNMPLLEPPMVRKPTRKVTLDELISALNKAMDYKEKKEERRLRIRRAVETLIEPEEDIEKRMTRIFEEIVTEIRIGKGVTKFSKIVPKWRRIAIITAFVPLLHLAKRGDVECEQEEPFHDIYIKFKAPEIKEPEQKDLSDTKEV